MPSHDTGEHLEQVPTYQQCVADILAIKSQIIRHIISQSLGVIIDDGECDDECDEDEGHVNRELMCHEVKVCHLSRRWILGLLVRDRVRLIDVHTVVRHLRRVEVIVISGGLGCNRVRTTQEARTDQASS
jgi:hypothetical protein